MARMLSRSAAVAWLVCVPAALGQAGGLYLSEAGGPMDGTAQAGQAAIARDAQTAFLNPAGMLRLDRPEILVSAMPFYLGLSFNESPDTTIPGNDGGQQGGWFPAGGLYIAAPIHERFAFGFSVTSPAGIVLDPDDDWAGRTWMTETTVLVLNFEPSIAFKIVDQLSIGFGVDIQYGDLEMDIGLPDPGGPLPIGGGKASIDGDNWEVGFSASLLWEPTDRFRIGARYRSEMDHSLSGDVTLVGRQKADTSLTLPQSVTVSAVYELSDRVALMADVGWTDWSAFDSTVINTAVDIALPRNWQDTWNGGLGLHFRPVERLLFMTGVSYVTSAVETQDRTPDLVADQQFRFSAGVEYDLTETIRVGGTFTYAHLGDNDINTTRGPGRLKGDYDANAFIIGLYAAFQF